MSEDKLKGKEKKNTTTIEEKIEIIQEMVETHKHKIELMKDRIDLSNEFISIVEKNPEVVNPKFAFETTDEYVDYNLRRIKKEQKEAIDEYKTKIHNIKQEIKDAEKAIENLKREREE